MQFDLHTHTIASGHGTNCTITDIAKAAYTRGLSLVGIADHGPATLRAGTPSYFRSLGMAPRFRYGIRLLYGVELNILDFEGNVDLEDDILEHLDYAIASMHIQNIVPGSLVENTKAYLAAMCHPKVKLLGHCDDAKYPVDFRVLVEGAKEHRVLLEVNEASVSPHGYRGNAIQNTITMLHWCQYFQHPIVLSSDSHGFAHVGDFTYGKTLLETLDFPKELILNYRLADLFQYTAIEF